MERTLEPELLDELPPDDPKAMRSRRDLKRLNWLMRNQSILADVLLPHCKDKRVQRFVDLGAGDGTFALGMAETLVKHQPDLHVVLVDRQAVVRPETHESFHRLGCTVETVSSDVFDWLMTGRESRRTFFTANLFLHHFHEAELCELFYLAAKQADVFYCLRTSALNGVTQSRPVYRLDWLQFRHAPRCSGECASWFCETRTVGNVAGRGQLDFAGTRRRDVQSSLRGATQVRAMQKPITIVGGGLAGLTLGIGLREKGVRVKIWEAGTYPRHRVCGEFISGRGQDTLDRFGLREKLMQAGACEAKTTAFFSRRKSSPVQTLENPALSISRYILDDLLAKRFQELGGELHWGERWRESEAGEGMVRASGRRVQSTVNGWRWYGLKVHATNVQLVADLEMHISPAGYVGICRLNEGEVNICGLFRRSTEEASGAQNWKGVLSGTPESLLRARLSGANFIEESFCSVAGLSLQPKRATSSDECCIGDALTMIPPVTGNGMSMAFESAEIAVAPLLEYSKGTISWSEAKSTIARMCDERFMKRLAWAEQLQRLMFVPEMQEALVAVVPRWEWLWKLFFKQTR